MLSSVGVLYESLIAQRLDIIWKRNLYFDSFFSSWKRIENNGGILNLDSATKAAFKTEKYLSFCSHYAPL